MSVIWVSSTAIFWARVRGGVGANEGVVVVVVRTVVDEGAEGEGQPMVSGQWDVGWPC